MTHPSRREFLTAAGVVAGAAATSDPAQLATVEPRRVAGKAERCLFVNLVGGPPHLDTFDPKPAAPAEVRGPFRSIRTRVPGTWLSELLPRLADLADRFSLIRSLHHTAPPVHEAGFQLLNTGRLFYDGPEWPNVGAAAAYLLGCRYGWRVLPHAEIETGIHISHGMGVGRLPTRASVGDPPARSARSARPAQAPDFATVCRRAVAWLEAGCRFVTVNQFATVFDAPSWDCHADGGSLRTDLNDLRATVAPAFDAAFARLLLELEERGLLDTTLVVATGEFGRTPLLNANGGRDHWAGAWSAVVAGGGIKPGCVIGRTDAKGTEPADRPVTPQEFVATILYALGVPADATIPGPDGLPTAVYPAAPVVELF